VFPTPRARALEACGLPHLRHHLVAEAEHVIGGSFKRRDEQDEMEGLQSLHLSQTTGRVR
jgi:hypothetical protein